MTSKAIIFKAIRGKCLDCSCHQPSEVRNCHLRRCDLWPFRLGRDPDTGQPRGVAKSSLPRGDSAEAEGADSTSEKRKTPVRVAARDRGDILFHRTGIRKDRIS